MPAYNARSPPTQVELREFRRKLQEDRKRKEQEATERCSGSSRPPGAAPPCYTDIDFDYNEGRDGPIVEKDDPTVTACYTLLFLAVFIIIFAGFSLKRPDELTKAHISHPPNIRRVVASTPEPVQLDSRHESLPTVDHSEPFKSATVENRSLGSHLGDPYLNFTVKMTSKLRHLAKYEIKLRNITVQVFNKDTLVGLVSSNQSLSMAPSIDYVYTEYRRHNVEVFVRSSIILKKGEPGFDKCTFIRPFSFPLRFHFTLDVRSEDEWGKHVDEVMEYDEQVKVCCNCGGKEAS